MPNLWSPNKPEEFWMCQENIPTDKWEASINTSLRLLDQTGKIENTDELLGLTLGEGQFGPNHWKLSPLKRLYYLLKPILPRSLTKILRRYYRKSRDNQATNNWPIDPRYALFQWDVIRNVLIATGNDSISFKRFWPDDFRFAFVLTHDIETENGQSFVRMVADLEESLGFRSSFNIVLERYPIDFGLIHELRDRGFEVGCHGLKHDGKLFNSESGFIKRANKINSYMKEFGMVGFRSPLTLRNPEWMQKLNIEYDSSFFDTDPFEPIPGGAMSIWPYFLGHFVELPYTLVQDYTLTTVLGETTPRIWLKKVEFIKEYHGLALLNTHPDYLVDRINFGIYSEFLQAMHNDSGFWHALPREVSAWWKTRAVKSFDVDRKYDHLGKIFIKGDNISVN